MFIINDRIATLIRLQRTWLKGSTTEDIQHLYYKSCTIDFKAVLPHIKTPPENILDIGAGMGGVDVLLFKHFGGTPDLVLLDADKVDAEISYGFSARASVYSKKSEVKEFLIGNGVPRKKFNLVKNFPDPSHKFDLITSFISCGFHYPLSVYMSNIIKGIKPEGVLILDIRKDITAQFDMLHDKFRFVDTIQDNKTYKKVVCRNQK